MSLQHTLGKEESPRKGGFAFPLLLQNLRGWAVVEQPVTTFQALRVFSRLREKLLLHFWGERRCKYLIETRTLWRGVGGHLP